jgi:hypothetical protein
MARIIEDGLVACDDCMSAIEDGDYTGMNDNTARVVRAGYVALFKRGYATTGDDLGFMWRACDCCKRATGGNRHELSLLA